MSYQLNDIIRRASFATRLAGKVSTSCSVPKDRDPVIVPLFEPVMVPDFDPVIVPLFDPVIVPVLDPVIVPPNDDPESVSVSAATATRLLSRFIFSPGELAFVCLGSEDGDRDLGKFPSLFSLLNLQITDAFSTSSAVPPTNDAPSHEQAIYLHKLQADRLLSK